jgi:hypothetical protein
MKWRFGSVKEKTRQFGEETSGKNEGSSKKKRSGRLFLGKRRRRDFREHSKEFCRRELSCASDLPLRLMDS